MLLVLILLHFKNFVVILIKFQNILKMKTLLILEGC